MADGESFYGAAVSGARDLRTAGLVVAVLVVVVGVAIAKPWGGTTPPSSSQIATASVSTSPGATTEVASPRVAGEPPVGPLPMDFTTPTPPPPAAAWSAIRWQRVSLNDPLALVASVIRWPAGYLAIGTQGGQLTTPVWTSSDGSTWRSLPVNTGVTFWPRLTVLAGAPLGRGIVALTEASSCEGTPCSGGDALPIASWTSTDGRRWTPHALELDSMTQPARSAPLLAAGPAGALVASTGKGARVAVSRDGAAWQLLPAEAFPAGFQLEALQGTTDGYAAVGVWGLDGSTTPALASLWSADGRSWPATPTLLPTASRQAATAGPIAPTLISGSDGLVAIGGETAVPGVPRWWQSPDGREWEALDGWPPLGVVLPKGVSGNGRPMGTLVGDGDHLVTLRAGPDAAAWISADGMAWQVLAMSGELPAEGATNGVLLPGGVLLNDGPDSWYGEAVGP